MKAIKTDVVLDAKGLACPMPIVKTKKAIKELGAGEVIEVQATDQGSKADLEAWAKSAGHQYVGTYEDGNVLKHYIRKSTAEEEIEKKHPLTISNEELEAKLHEQAVLLDVREEAEFAFSHIPGAISMPLAELDKRMTELNKEEEIYVVCRTGNRSDLAAQKLVSHGHRHVYNVLPGMSAWKGKTQSESGK